MEDGRLVARVLVQPDLADPKHAGPVEELGDHGDHLARQSDVLGLLGIDAQPRVVRDAVGGGAAGLVVGQLAEVVAESLHARPIEARPERRLADHHAAGQGHALVVVGGAGHHVDVGVDVLHRVLISLGPRLSRIRLIGSSGAIAAHPSSGARRGRTPARRCAGSSRRGPVRARSRASMAWRSWPRRGSGCSPCRAGARSIRSRVAASSRILQRASRKSRSRTSVASRRLSMSRPPSGLRRIPIMSESLRVQTPTPAGGTWARPWPGGGRARSPRSSLSTPLTDPLRALT